MIKILLKIYTIIIVVSSISLGSILFYNNSSSVNVSKVKAVRNTTSSKIESKGSLAIEIIQDTEFSLKTGATVQAANDVQLKVIDLSGIGDKQVGQIVTYRYQLKNTGDTAITGVEFNSEYNPKRMRLDEGDNIAIFFEYEDQLDGKRSIHHDNLVEILGAIEPGQTKSFDFSFVLISLVNNTCIDTTIEYDIGKITDINKSSKTKCLGIEENPPNTDL